MRTVLYCSFLEQKIYVVNFLYCCYLANLVNVFIFNIHYTVQYMYCSSVSWYYVQYIGRINNKYSISIVSEIFLGLRF
jgi:hypothetical protein